MSKRKPPGGRKLTRARMRKKAWSRAGDWADEFYGESEPEWYEEDDMEPIGSCENCGTNIYASDLSDDLCDQCDWHAQQFADIASTESRPTIIHL